VTLRTLFFVSLAACAAPAGISLPEPAEAPLVAGEDAADTECRVVLRSARRWMPDGLPETHCDESGLCWLVFEVEVDGEGAALLYETPDGWVEQAADPDGVFRLRTGTVRTGLSAAGLAAARLRLIPFVRSAGGGRYFDHNRLADPLASYELRGDQAFVIEDDPAVCADATNATNATNATLRFAADWSETQEGTLLAGGAVVIDYDLSRLDSCIGDTYMGQRTWSVTAYARFDGGDVVAEPAYACDDARCDDPRARLVELEVPEDASELELWFGTAGRACASAWDTDFGRNYRFAIRQPVGWVGGFAVKSSRAGGAPCEGAAEVDAVGYGTWDRVRAVTSHVCFRVWQAGVTETTGDVDVSLVCDWGDGVERRHGVSFDGNVGNDARFRADLRSLDPFRPYRCPEIPHEVVDGYELAEARCAIEANGARWGVDGEGGELLVAFRDYPDDYWRGTHCD